MCAHTYVYIHIHGMHNLEMSRSLRSSSLPIPWPLEREGTNDSFANVIDMCSNLEWNYHGAETDLAEDVGRKYPHLRSVDT